MKVAVIYNTKYLGFVQACMRERDGLVGGVGCR
ncbi:MAG: hypothetical protein ACI85K_003432 [Hyphomicrobiaceae bacterium]|jgi:hypothetical protein